jgi:hypothetical protein
MGLIAKFAWIVLPALAGCGVLSQVSSQGTGTNPGGGKARPILIEDFENGLENWDVKGFQFLPDGKVLDWRRFNEEGSKRNPPRVPIMGANGTRLFTTRDAKEGGGTGNLTSKPFKINFSTIKANVGGGQSPNLALEVLVDGKVVGSATGANNLTLSDVSFDVSSFKGKDAQIRIRDDEPRARFGHLMVDNIRGSESSIMLPAASSAGLSWLHGELQLVDFVGSQILDGRRRNRSVEAYGMDDAQVVGLLNLITRRVSQPDFDHVPGISVKNLASNIDNAVGVLVNEHVPNAKKPLVTRLRAQAAFDWVRCHLVYNRDLNDMSLDREVRKRHWTPEQLLRMDRPNAVCAGFANTMAALGKAMGLDTYTVNGEVRGNLSGDHLPPEEMKALGHKWVQLRHEDGYIEAFDVSRGAVALETVRGLGEPFEPVMSPVSYNDWILHFAVNRAVINSDSGAPLSTQEKGTSLGWAQWRALNLAPLGRLASFARGRWYDSAVVNWQVR